MRKELEGILFDSRVDAEYTLDYLNERLYRHGFVTVFDLHNYIGGTNHPDNKERGWTDLSTARIYDTGGEPWRIGVRKCYRLYLPEMLVIPVKKQGTYVTVDRHLDDSKDNSNAILKLLGNKYSMELHRDINSGVLTVRIKDGLDRTAIRSISHLEILIANHDILLWHVKKCILAIEGLD